MTRIDTVSRLIKKNRYPIIFFWVLVTIYVAGLYASNFIPSTSNGYKPPEGSEAALAENLMNAYFPNKLDEQAHIIILHDENENIISTKLADFTSKLYTEYHDHDRFTSLGGYFIFANTELDSVKMEYVSDDMHTSLLVLELNGNSAFQIEIAEELRDFTHSYDFGQIEAYVIGTIELDIDTETSIENDLSTIDTITIPLVFLATIFLIGNWRYIFLTLLPVLMTIGISFGILERLINETGIAIQSFVPSVLISLTLGISVDYSLFLLSRFREEKQKGKSNDEAVKVMLKYAGHTVLTSGITLTIAMAGQIFFPVVVLSSVGYAISTAIFILLLINLTLIPSLLYIFGDWFDKPSEKKTDNKIKKGFFFKVGKFATKYNWLVLGIILLLTLPLVSQITNINTQSQVEFFAPIGSESNHGFTLMRDEFGPGALSPMSIILVPDSQNVWSEDVFQQMQTFIGNLINTTDVGRFDVASIAWLNGSAIPWTLASMFINPVSPVYNLTDAQLYRLFASQYVSSGEDLQNKAVYIQINLPVDPYGEDANSLIDDINSLLAKSFADTEYGIVGTTVVNKSTIDKTYDVFPLMILLVILAIYLLIGMMFKAVILPARLIATIALTISFIYGAATVIFEYTTFLNDYLPSLDGVDVIFWMMPVMSFSVILGLGIDYDVFTIERIKENVWDGMSNNDAIAYGLNNTAKLITGAGLIMLIAFGGLLFSSSYILIQFGFVLAFAVLLDTFLVRTLLVPAIMSFANTMNWWPSRPNTKNENIVAAD